MLVSGGSVDRRVGESKPIMSRPNLNEWIERLKSSSADMAKGLDEIPAEMRQDTARAYSFYHPEEAKKALPAGGLSRHISLSKALFLSFLRRLSPARRIAYVAALIAFVWGYLQNDWIGAIGGFAVLNFLLALELAEKLLTKGELEIARAIQFSLYPESSPALAHLDISSYFEPAQDVGGDYYDFALEGQKRFTVIMGDVSGKGIPAALYAMKLQALFELLGKSELGPKEMLVEMNDVISERIERNYFITAVVGVVDLENQKLAIARAGHNHPLHFSSQTQQTSWLKPNGIGIGMRKGETFGGLLEEQDVTLAPGDVLLFYTDGVSEAMNASSETYGYDAMANVVKANAHLPAAQIKERILESVNAFRQGTPFADDATLVVTKVV